MSLQQASRYHWRVLLLDMAARYEDSLTDRVLALAGVDLDVRPVSNLDELKPALEDSHFDFALIAGSSLASLAQQWSQSGAANLPPELALLLVLDESPDEAEVLECGMPIAAVLLRRSFTGGDLLAAMWQARLGSMFFASPDGMLLLDAMGSVQASNPAALRLLGKQTAELRAEPLELTVNERGQHEWTSAGGRVLEWRKQSLSDTGAAAVVTLRDVTEQRVAAQALAFRAEHDPLTGLANPQRLWQELSSALARADRDAGRVAVLYVDLDGFKQINDMYGHEVGDALLVAVAQRLTGICRAGELLSRMGGDELVMVAESFPPGFEARIAERVLAALASPLRAAGRTVRVGASVGVAVYPDHASDSEGLLRAADEAMYEAKRNGRDGYSLATSHADTISQHRQDIADGLQVALLRDELHLLYQPVLDLKRGQIVGAEALLRWNRPGVGTLHPMEFLDVAETTGLIVGIGDWVFDQICRQLAQWRWVLGEDFFVCANLSATQLRRADFAGRFRRILHSHGLTSKSVRLEISERVMAQELGRALGDITAATDMYIAVDDVSQGLLSLRNLSSLPIRSLKLDSSLVAGLPDDVLSAQLTEALISIGRTFNLSVVAEGVENAAQLAFLRERGCDYCQGFLLSAPVPAADFPSLVKTPELLDGLVAPLK
ncbi:putative bifunctional diguanylate cyclase/phosphodiesterase [Immundisolibacter sp.]|uniref:putative bifunctional diguanylate cyclase/phosphodiesterase n=1 Tax=Immundisolibacter sp. TaxID=1934948 RepID=UPI00356A42DC